VVSAVSLSAESCRKCSEENVKCAFLKPDLPTSSQAPELHLGAPQMNRLRTRRFLLGAHSVSSSREPEQRRALSRKRMLDPGRTRSSYAARPSNRTVICRNNVPAVDSLCPKGWTSLNAACPDLNLQPSKSGDYSQRGREGWIGNQTRRLAFLFVTSRRVAFCSMIGHCGL
jgi:hypothetical protein